MTSPAMIADIILHTGYSGVFTVPGVPVTETLVALSQRIPVVACRTEQAAAHAAAAYGFQAGGHALESLQPLLKKSISNQEALDSVDWDAYERLRSIGGPGLCISTCGPAFINALSGVSTAAANCWPLVVLSSTVGDYHDDWFHRFQQYPQTKISQGLDFVKEVSTVNSLAALETALCSARRTASKSSPGVVLIQCDWSVWKGANSGFTCTSPRIPHLDLPRNPIKYKKELSEALLHSKKPLCILGKGLAYSGGPLLSHMLGHKTKKIPMLLSPMGKGIIGEDDVRNCGAARSFVMKESDMVLVFGARLNWMFNPSSGWLDNKKSIFFFNHGHLVGDQFEKTFSSKIINDEADATVALMHLLDEYTPSEEQTLWMETVEAKCSSAKASHEASKTEESKQGLQRRWEGGYTFAAAFEAIHKASEIVKANASDCPSWLFGSKPTSYVVEGATSMDKSRIHLPIECAKQRMDAATFGAMGVGTAFAVGVAMWKLMALKTIGWKDLDRALNSAPVVLIQGDHAFGFSGLEIETIGRYELPIKMIVLDNGGMYAMDTSESRADVSLGNTLIEKRFASTSITDLTTDTKFSKIAEAFNFSFAMEAEQANVSALQDQLVRMFKSSGPGLLGVKIDPLDGSQAGFISRMH